jgi:hypothetical protein
MIKAQRIGVPILSLLIILTFVFEIGRNPIATWHRFAGIGIIVCVASFGWNMYKVSSEYDSDCKERLEVLFWNFATGTCGMLLISQMK